MAGKQLERINNYIDVLQTFAQILEFQEMEGIHLVKGLINYTIEGFEDVIKCVEAGKPLACGLSYITPEILTALDIVPLTFQSGIYLSVFVGSDEFVKDLEGAERMGFSTDYCSALRCVPYLIENELYPTPDMIIACTHACDSVPTMFNVVSSNKVWGKVPTFALDGPFKPDERGLKYYSEEIGRFVSFLEEHSGNKLDLDRLREILKQSNRQIELWREYMELRRAVPCPHSESNMLGALYGISQCFGGGKPAATAWFEDLVADAEAQISAVKDRPNNEKIRILYGDIQGTWSSQLYLRLVQEWGAVVVMDMVGDCPYTPIDLSSRVTIYRGLAERMWHQIPMHGQMMGPVDSFLDRMVFLAKNYDVDCVIFPGHIGHKELTAATNIIVETFRELDIPILVLECDIWDPRPNSVDSLMDKIGVFLDTMELGR